MSNLRDPRTADALVQRNSNGDLAQNVAAELPVSPGDDATLGTRIVTDGLLYKQVSADAIVKTGEGYVGGYIVVAGAASTLILYDNTAASGSILHKAAAVDASATSVIVTFPKPIKFSTGLYADVGGASVAINVLYI